MTVLKSQLLEDLDAIREKLWDILAVLDDRAEIYPGWRKREFLAHMAGWDAMVFDVFYRHVTGQEPKDYAYTGIDSMNARFTAVRQSTTVQDAKLECEINRFALRTLLDGIEDFGTVIRLPWGSETVSDFVQGAVDHERNHAVDIIALLPPGADLHPGL